MNDVLDQVELALRRGETQTAERYIAIAVQRSENCPRLDSLRGIAARQRDKLTSARKFFKSALDAQPRSSTYAFNHALACYESHDPRAATASLNQCLKLAPKMRRARLLRLRIARRLSHIENAMKQAQALVHDEPDFPGAWLELGKLPLELFDRERAKACFTRVLEQRPHHTAALSALASVAPTSTLITPLTHCLDNRQLSRTQRASLLLALARCQHQAKRFDEAFQLLSDGNAILDSREPAYDRTRFESYLAALARHAPIQIDSCDNNRRSRRPLFILGPSCSGKSLLEYVLAQNIPGLVRGFESRVVHATHQRVLQATQGAFDSANVRLDQLDMLYSCFRDAVSRSLTQVADDQAFTLTRPQDIALVLPLLAAMPNSRLIGVFRDPADTALSILMRDYEPGNPYHTRFDNAQHHVRTYQNVLHELARLFPDRVMIVEYADIVRDAGAISRRCAEFAGLGWRPAETNLQISGEIGIAGPYLPMLDPILSH